MIKIVFFSLLLVLIAMLLPTFPSSTLPFVWLIKYILTIIAVLLIATAYVEAREYTDSRPFAFYISIGVLFFGTVFHYLDIVIPNFIITFYIIYFVILLIGVLGTYVLATLN